MVAFDGPLDLSSAAAPGSGSAVSPMRADPEAHLVEKAVLDPSESPSSPANPVGNQVQSVIEGNGGENAPADTPVEMPLSQKQVQGPATQEPPVSRAVAESRRKVSKDEVEKRGTGASVTIFLASLWLVLMGVILIFCFSPANVDLAIACMLLGVIVGIIGMLAVSTKSENGVRLYLILASILLVLTVILWGYNIYTLARAGRAADDVAHHRLQNWLEDSGSFPTDFDNGSSRNTRFRTRDGSLPEVALDADVLKPCQDGYERRGKDYAEDVGAVYSALAFRGQMCNYSHYDILKFKKWPEDCWKTCGFEYLATGDSFELNDWSHIAVLDQFKANLQALPNDKQLACAIYSVRTACVVENTSYVYVLLGVMSLFFLCSCCGCLCCLPASLLVSGRYLKELRNYNKATTALGESPSPPAGHVQMTTP